MQSDMTEKKLSDLFLAYDSTYKYIKNLQTFNLMKQAFYQYMHGTIINNRKKLSGTILNIFINKLKNSSFGKDMDDYFSKEELNDLFNIDNCA